jgi:hypothetical protein
MELRLVNEVEVPGSSIFVSRVDTQKCVYRSVPVQNSDIYVGELTDLSTTLQFKHNLCKGEDPRVVLTRGKVFVLDNTLNQCRLINLDDSKETYSVPLKGKNFVFLPSEDELYVVEWLAPLCIHRVVSFGFDSLVLDKVFQGTERSRPDLRGGTNVCEVSKHKWIGLGHRTHYTPRLTHDPFYYVIEKKVDSFSIQISKINVNDRPAIFDPCCLYKTDDHWFVVSAESELPWYKHQNLKTRLYELNTI